MAQMNLNLPDGFIRELEKLGHLDETAPRMLEAAAPIIVNALKKEAGKHRDTGDLQNSIKAGKPKLTKTNAYIISAGPTGKDRKGMSNASKMVWLEHGTSKMSPRPMIAAAVNSSEDEVMLKMQETFNAVMEGK